jgi:hypothetical protein
MSRVRHTVGAAILGLVLAGVSGCGVAVQEEAQSLPSGALPQAAPTPTPSQTAREDTIFFVSGRGLEGVTEPVNDHSATGVMAALAAGPPVERQANLRTLLLDPLTGEPLLSVVSVGPSGQVVLARSDAFTLLSATDQVLLVGQVVTSMNQVGLTSVVITDAAGVAIPLVLPDGRVLEGPARVQDYEALVVVPGT